MNVRTIEEGMSAQSRGITLWLLTLDFRQFYGKRLWPVNQKVKAENYSPGREKNLNNELPRVPIWSMIAILI